MLLTFVLVVVASLTLLYQPVSSAAGHHHAIHDTFHFYYDPEGRYLVGGNSIACFFTNLTHAEQDDMYTSIGISQIESTMMHDWIGKLPEVRLYHDDPILTKNIQHWCHSQQIFYLDRTSQSPHVVATTIGSFPVSTTRSAVTITRRSATSLPTTLRIPTTRKDASISTAPPAGL